MDALSDILNTIRLQSSVYFRSDFSSPWGMQIDRGPFAQFHMLVRGNCWLSADSFKEPLPLSGGDIVIFPFGDAHWIVDDLKHKRTPGRQVVEALRRNESIFQGERITATLVCGHFEFDRDVDHPFMRALPRFIHLSGIEQRQLSWLETITNVIIQEAGSGNPGSEVVITRLAEVLFIHILRAYMIQKNISNGYFAALKDRQINEALNMIHTRPQNNWKLENIARAIGMSRSAFAARFKQLVGMTPIGYVTNWRMHKAREMLKDQNLSLIEIAEKVGYTSEAAFNRAFKRRFNQNPGAMRRAIFSRANP
jgi:AraC-like DNA-binding protein